VTKNRLLIIGGGFGGVYTYLNLPQAIKFKMLETTIISRSENFTFAPMIIESLNGDIDAKYIEFPLKDIITSKKARIIVTEELSIDLKMQQVRTNDDVLEYDYLVVATGSRANYFNIPGAEAYSHPLKSLEDVAVIARKVSESTSKGQSLISIVGAGPTGVEIAVKINGLAQPIQSGQKYLQARITVQLIEASDRILTYLPLGLTKKATEVLQKQGITIRTGASINRVSKNALHLSDGKTIQSDLIIWTAGVSPNIPAIVPTIARTRNGQIKTDSYLRVLGYENVFALGDAASIESTVASVPASAQAAVASSKIVAKNIVAIMNSQEIQPFNYRSSNTLIPLGRWKGVGQLAGININGPIVWVGWKLIYLWRFPVASRRIDIVRYWFLKTIS
jgi:NADH dehydrogenase